MKSTFKKSLRMLFVAGAFVTAGCDKQNHAPAGNAPAETGSSSKKRTSKVSAAAGAFLLPVFPDTQCAVNYNEAMFQNQVSWLINNKTTQEIPFTLHVGDVIDWDDPTHEQWNIASNQFARLDQAGMDYAIAVGNHDTEAVTVGGGAAEGSAHDNLRKTTQFNSFFPVSRFTNQARRWETGKSDNAVYTFKAEGLDWLVVTLEFLARQTAVDWANSVIPLYPNHNVIILTHYHLRKGDASGTGVLSTDPGYGDLSPQQVEDRLVRKHKNIRFVISGHTDDSATKISTGENGNKVYEILNDYQKTDNGGGYIRLLEINPSQGTVIGKMYSPHYNKTLTDHSAFTFSGVSFVPAVAAADVKRWSFNTDGNHEGWTSGQLTTSVSGGKLNATTRGGTSVDPRLISPDNLGVGSTATNRYVHVLMNNNTTMTSGRIYFITNADPSWNQTKSKAFTVQANSTEVDYKIDMGAVSGWAGTIKQIRVDPFDPMASNTVTTTNISRISISHQ